MATSKKRAETAAPLSIQLTAHPPERHRRGDPVILACGCCCCCCCCLHSVGSIIGSIIGSVKYLEPLQDPSRPDLPPPLAVHPTDTRITAKPPADTRITDKPADPDVSFPFRRDDLGEDAPLVSAGALYWLLLIFLLLIGFILFSASNRNSNPLVWLLLDLIFLPGFQLVASILSAIAAVLFYTNRAAALARIGYITLYSVIGTLIGLGVMWLLFLSLK